MTTETNRLAKSKAKEKSPTDPQECCDWANERMNPELAAYGVRWIVTGNKDQPIALSDRCAPRLLSPRLKPLVETRSRLDPEGTKAGIAPDNHS